METSAKKAHKVHKAFCDLVSEMDIERKLVKEAIEQNQDDFTMLGNNSLASQLEILRNSGLRDLA
jgi:hypothetical protein